MLAPLERWLTGVLEWRDRSVLHRRQDYVHEFDSRTRRWSPLAPRFATFGVSFLASDLNDEGGYVAFLDFLVWKLTSGTADEQGRLPTLDGILQQAGSAWRVGVRASEAGLERRVPEGVQEAADQAMATPGHAGSLLSEAWHAAFGLNPDYEKAYAKSIKAVEAAAIPVVSPNNVAATLGTVLGQIRADGNWSLDITRKHSVNTPAEVILGMAQALWTGHNDRHAGQPGYTASTQAEAEAAVFLAVPLVQFFSSGAVARR